ncbi:class I SAM-dependent methyltransferase [Paenibacillus tarimensis]
MSNWYERSFGSDYMVVYRHRDWDNAYREVKNMAVLLDLPEGAEVLDVGCGMGRHALALADYGCRVTGIDLSEPLLEEALRRDIDRRVKWVRGDMRKLPFEDGEFQATVNLFTSFGYFEQEPDNDRVIKELRRVLRTDGKLLIDYFNPSYVTENLVPRSERLDEETGWTIQEFRTADSTWVRKEIVITDPKEGERRYTEQVRLLDLGWFKRAWEEAGLELTGVYGDYDGSDYSAAASKRMIMLGRVRP